MSNIFELKYRWEDGVVNRETNSKTNRVYLEEENVSYLCQKPLQPFYFIFSRVQFTTWPEKGYCNDKTLFTPSINAST
jgi:hypothetical protein